MSNKKFIVALNALFILLAISTCYGKMVNSKDFIEKPKAVRSGDTIRLDLGFTAASANWIKPDVKIENESIFVSGKLSFKELPQIVSIKLPDSHKNYRLFWVDEDGKKTEIPVLKK